MITRTLLNFIPLKPCFKGTCKMTHHAGTLYDILVVNTTVVLTVIYACSKDTYTHAVLGRIKWVITKMIEVWSKEAMPCLKLLDSPMYYKDCCNRKFDHFSHLSVVIQYTDSDN